MTLCYKGIYKTFLLLLLIVPLSATAQNDWKQTTLNGGKALVKYKVETVTKSDGTEHVVAEYYAKTVINTTLANAEKFLRNSANYKSFLDNTEVSKKISSLSGDSWLIYLFLDIPWPMPNADCVQEMTVTRTEKELIVNAVSKPNAYPLQGEERMTISDSKYHFVQTPSGAVELILTGKFAPVGSVKEFMLEMWFPNGPIDLIKRLEAQIKAQ